MKYLKVHTHTPTDEWTDDIELPDDWNSMSPEQRESWADKAAEEVFFNNCNYGWTL